MKKSIPHVHGATLTGILLASITPFLVAGPPPRIDPKGIDGAVILCGAGEVAEKTIDQFIALAHGAEARIVVVDCSAKGECDFGRILKKRLTKRKLADPYWVAIAKHKNKSDRELHEKLRAATGIWFLADDEFTPRSVLKQVEFTTDKKMTSALSALVARKGVIATSGQSTTAFPWRDYLPDSMIEALATKGATTKFKDFLKQNSNRFGVHIAPGAALLVRGRRLFALTDTPVDIHLPASQNRAAKRIRLVRRKVAADLIALRRAVRNRALGNFPPKKPAPPVVEKGTLIIIGGGGMPKGLIQRMVDLAGGKKAEIVILPTAMPDPISKRSGMATAFRKAGAKKVTVLPQRRLKDVESKEFLDTLKSATGIWFGGGRQWRFVDAYENTKAHKLMFDVLRRGGVIAGSSAGASIQAEYMARGNPLGNLDIMAEGYERGLGFLKGVAVDQHFARRKRFRDMTELVRTYPQLLGIGIDEATAITVQGSVAEVTGRGKVYFYDTKRKIEKGQPDYVAVPAGGRYDLKMRKTLPNAAKQLRNPKSKIKNQKQNK